MLGFGGHFLTKARRYSVTFGDLREARIFYRRSQDTGPEHGPIRTADHTDEETILIVGTFPTPEPAGKPPATPCSPTPPPTRPANDARPDATSLPTKRPTVSAQGRPHNRSHRLTLKCQNRQHIALRRRSRSWNGISVRYKAIDPPKWYTTDQVAEMLGYGLTKTKHLVLSGQIRSVKDGGNRRILPEWIDDYVRRVVKEEAG